MSDRVWRLLKNRLDAVDERLFIAGSDFVQIIDDGTVKRVEELLRPIHRQRERFVGAFHGEIGVFYHAKTGVCREVETVTEIEDRSYNAGFSDSSWFAGGDFLRELEAAERIGFPEVNSFAEPVIIVLAEAEFLVQQERGGKTIAEVRKSRKSGVSVYSR